MELEKSDVGGNENRIGQVKTITKLAVLNKILFVFNLFYINASLIAVRLVNFQSSGKSSFCFYQFSHQFYRGENFGGSFLHHFF